MSKKKLNILMMVSWYSPKGEVLGGGSFHYVQAKSLNQYCNCAIYTPYDRTIMEPFSSEIEWGIRTYRSKYKLENKIRNRIYMLSAMRKIINEFHPDLIHANVATEAGRFAVALGRIYRIPVMITEHSAVEASGVTSFPHYYYARYAYKYSRYNACVSDKLTNNLKTIFPKYEFHTIYNGIETPNEITGSICYRKNGYINMVIVASLYDKNIKGLQVLLPVMKRLITEHEKIFLHIVGGGEYMEYYQNIAQSLQLDNYVHFYGECIKSKVFEIVAQMDFMVSASLFESFGCSIAEGMMLGKPAVGTKCGGLESIINDETGILVEKNNEKALYEGIKKMMREYDSYSAEKIATYAQNKFSVERISREYMEIYERILGESDGRK